VWDNNVPVYCMSATPVMDYLMQFIMRVDISLFCVSVKMKFIPYPAECSVFHLSDGNYILCRIILFAM
jgi:hypothetical protein